MINANDSPLKDQVLRTGFRIGLFSDYCVKTLSAGDLFDPTCLKHLQSRVLNIGIICGSSIVQLPQLLKILLSKSSAGVSDTGYIVNAFSCLCFVFYNIHEGINFGTWGETLFVGLQYIMLMIACWTYAPQRPSPTKVWTSTSLLTALIVCHLTGCLPEYMYPLMGLAPTPLMVFGKLPQVIQNYRQGHTGHLSIVSSTLSLCGNLARVVTSLTQVNDLIILMTHLLAGTLNALPVLQPHKYSIVARPSDIMGCKREAVKLTIVSKEVPCDKICRIQAGDVLPDIEVKMGDTVMSMREYFTRRTAVLFAVPGAFTPVCTEAHLPGFVSRASEVRQHVDEVICMCVNDPFVVKAWAKSSDAENSGIIFLPDPLAVATRAMGMEQDLNDKGLGIRSERFAMILAQGRVHWIGINDTSFVESVLDGFKSLPPMKGLDLEKCLEEARTASKNSHSPYTDSSKCGVAIQTDKGIIKGATFQSCAYPNSICAVKAAIVAAMSEGITRMDGVVVAGSKSSVPYVCGQCREMLSQFGNIPIALYSSGNEHLITHVSNLLPGKVWESPDSPLAKRSFELSESDVEGYKPDDTVKATPELLDLYDRAIKACRLVYTPMSHFPVGAAVLTDAGMFSGSNIEHRLIGLGLCAERTTLCKAIAGGAKKIKEMAVVCYKMEGHGSPCGGCRQSLVEFEDYPVHLLKMNHKNKTFSVRVSSSLKQLPDAFTPAALK